MRSASGEGVVSLGDVGERARDVRQCAMSEMSLRLYEVGSDIAEQQTAVGVDQSGSDVAEQSTAL